jgi:hypothetical protein
MAKGGAVGVCVCGRTRCPTSPSPRDGSRHAQALGVSKGPVRAVEAAERQTRLRCREQSWRCRMDEQRERERVADVPTCAVSSVQDARTIPGTLQEGTLPKRVPFVIQQGVVRETAAHQRQVRGRYSPPCLICASGLCAKLYPHVQNVRFHRERNPVIGGGLRTFWR